MLASIVKHFATHGGDQRLREALTGVRAKETETAPMRPVQASVQAKCSPKLGLPARLSKGTPRPLCPPLKLAVGLPTICQYGSFAYCYFTGDPARTTSVVAGFRPIVKQYHPDCLT
jgi:hypothetical protein